MKPRTIVVSILVAFAGLGLLFLYFRQGTIRLQKTDVPSGSVSKVVHTVSTPQKVLENKSKRDGGKEIVDMSVVERNIYFQELLKESPEFLFEQWLNLIVNKTDVLRSQIIADALVSNLHDLNGGDDSVYSGLRANLSNTESALETRLAVTQLLDDIATTNSLRILLDQATSESNPQIKQALKFALSAIGTHRWGNRFHEELSPQLEEALPVFENDPELFQAIMHSLAQVGAPTGIETMYRYLNGMATVPTRLPGQLDDPRSSLLGDFRQIQNPNAVLALKRHLATQSTSDLELVVTGEALMSVATSESTEVILEWAAVRRDYVGAIVEKWLSPLNELDRLKSTIQDFTLNQAFVNEQNRQAVRRVFESK